MKVILVANKKTKFLLSIYLRLINNNKIIKNKYSKVSYHPCELTNIRSTDLAIYQLIVVFDLLTIFEMRKLITGTPIVLVWSGLLTDLVLPQYVNLQKVIIVNSDFQPLSWNIIPDEMMIFAPLNSFAGYLSTKIAPSEVRIGHDFAYVIDSLDDSTTNAKKLISYFNYRPHFKLEIITTQFNRFMLEGLCNGNISFSEKNAEKIKLNQISGKKMVFGCEDLAEYCLLKGIPVFVIGKFGLGDLVSNENISDFFRTGFRGRVGGVSNEEIPFAFLELLVDKAILKLESQPTSISAEILARYRNLCELSIERIHSEIINILELNSLIESNNTSKLHLKICSYIRIKTINDHSSLILNSRTGTIITTIDADQKLIIEECRKGINVLELQSFFSNYSPRSIFEFVKELMIVNVLILSEEKSPAKDNV